jgi:glutamine amidotransferase
MITIIDYGVGNINAFINVYKRLNIPVRTAKSISDLENVEKLILPGVGHFDHAMNQLNCSGMRSRIDHLVLDQKVPVIGICVGMQMMAKASEEGKEKGLGWIDATVKKFDETKINQITKLPHMGWNDVTPVKTHSLFNDLEEKALFYFLHKYYFQCIDSSDILAVSEYAGEFSCAIHRGNIFGIQFHPEKSHHYGEKLLHNFATI